MKIASYEQILNIVQKTNILPIISVCNIKCEFCSHKNNPKDIDVYTLPKLTNEQVEELIEYLSPDEKIVIGESASRIVEGEPFLYKDFMYILKLIREKYKTTLIQITTNGSFLYEDTIRELSKLEPIEINLSLNSSCPENRKKLIMDKKPQIAIRSCKLLDNYNINYNGSLVVMPHITGYEDVKNTIIYLCENGASFVRVFIPGFTKYSEMKFTFEELYTQSIKLVKTIREKYDTPIVVEPPIIDDFDADIEGILKQSPAFDSGLKCNDIITKVDGIEVKSRVHAFNLSYRRKNPTIEFIRNNKVYNTVLKKEKSQSPGFVMNYDIDPSIIDEIENKIIRNKS
jgi:NifB/MoaA-like Fe-S oxidoreductase